MKTEDPVRMERTVVMCILKIPARTIVKWVPAHTLVLASTDTRRKYVIAYGMRVIVHQKTGVVKDIPWS